MPYVPMPNQQAQEDRMDFTDRYNTRLSPEDEMKFQAWVSAVSQKEGRDRSRDLYDYDLRGFWKSGAAFAKNGHGSDKWKKPNHPTFSDQSIYNGEDGFKGGKWGKKNGKDTFMPADTSLWPIDKLQEYMKRADPGVELVLPKRAADVLYSGGN